MKNQAYKTSSSMIPKDHVARYEKLSLYAELVGNMVSHARLHIGLTVFKHINMSLQEIRLLGMAN